MGGQCGMGGSAAPEAARAAGAAPLDAPLPDTPRDAPPRRHRRGRSSADSLADLSLPLPPGAAAARALAEAWRLLGLALRLWSYLGLGAQPPPRLGRRSRSARGPSRAAYARACGGRAAARAPAPRRAWR
jgi:hypothetical protein